MVTILNKIRLCEMPDLSDSYFSQDIDYKVSPDCTRIACKTKSGGKVAVLVNGHQEGVYDNVEYFFFSPNSKRLAYVVQTQNRHFVVCDGEKGPDFDSISNSWITFSADSSRSGYIGQRAGKSIAVIDGQIGPAFDGIGANSVVFSPDSAHALYWAREGDRSFVIFDDTKGPGFDEVCFFAHVYSPDSSRRAFKVRNLDKWSLHLDNRIVSTHKNVEDFVFSPGSKRYAYVAVSDDGTARMIVDGPGDSASWSS